MGGYYSRTKRGLNGSNRALGVIVLEVKRDHKGILVVGTMYFVCRAMSGMKCLQRRAEHVATLQRMRKMYSWLGFGYIFRNGYFLCKLRVRKWKGKKRS